MNKPAAAAAAARVPDLSEIIDVTQEIHVIETMEELMDIVPAETKPLDRLSCRRLRVEVPFSLDLLRRIEHRGADQRKKEEMKKQKKFLARINPDDTAVAEAELSRQISQQDFAKVQLIRPLVGCIENLKFSIIVEETYPIVLIFSGFHPGIHCNKKISQSRDNFANEKPLPVFFVKSENMTSCSKKKCLRYTILYYIKT